MGKSFEKSAPCNPLRPAAEIGHPTECKVFLSVNGILRQQGDLNQLLWKVPEMIAILSEYFEPQLGDLILTGTPSGVGAVNKGDIMHARFTGLGQLTVAVV